MADTVRDLAVEKILHAWAKSEPRTGDCFSVRRPAAQTAVDALDGALITDGAEDRIAKYLWENIHGADEPLCRRWAERVVLLAVGGEADGTD